METKTKEQAGAELLAAIDTYISVVLAEAEKKKIIDHRNKLQEYCEKHKNDVFQIPEDARGPYAQCLREEYGNQ